MAVGKIDACSFQRSHIGRVSRLNAPITQTVGHKNNHVVRPVLWRSDSRRGDASQRYEDQDVPVDTQRRSSDSKYILSICSTTSRTGDAGIVTGFPSIVRVALPWLSPVLLAKAITVTWSSGNVSTMLE